MSGSSRIVRDENRKSGSGVDVGVGLVVGEGVGC
jgi:hypothetical protein